MITRIEALNYRCLRYVSRTLGSFHVLVGPNGSGKTTFLDVVGLLHDVVNDGPAEAIASRSSDPRDLLFAHSGSAFEVAIEARIPAEKRKLITRPEMDTVRYELSLGSDHDSGQFVILAEGKIGTATIFLTYGDDLLFLRHAKNSTSHSC